MSQTRQLALLEAGCQPWNGEIVAVSENRFAYCATLAIYIYELHRNSGEFLLHSIMSEHKRTITSIAWHPTNPDLLASSSVDAHVLVWSVSEKRPLAQLSAHPGVVGLNALLPPTAQPRSVAWVPLSDSHGSLIFQHTLSFLNGRGPLFLWHFDLTLATPDVTHHRRRRSSSGHTPITGSSASTGGTPPALQGPEFSDTRRGSMSSTTSSVGAPPVGASGPSMSSLGGALLHRETHALAGAVTRYRWNPQRTGQIVFGHDDGTVSIYTAGTKPHRRIVLGEPSVEEAANDRAEGADAVTGLEWDPVSSGSGSAPHLLVASALSGLRLVDVDSLALLQTFQLPASAAQVHSLAWIPGAPGMFLVGDSNMGIVRIFSVAKSTPLDTIRIKQTGFRALTIFQAPSSSIPGHLTGDSNSMSTERRSKSQGDGVYLPPANMLCTFLDGGVGLYDLPRRKWAFLREMGHIETIFDCRFKNNNCNLLATASFDGTVKIWDVRDMKPLTSSSGDEGIIYAISWAPGDSTLLAAATSKNGVYVFDTSTGSITTRFSEHTGPVYGLAWNSKDVKLIASVSGDGSCVVRRLDGSLLHRYRHPSAVFGVDWSVHAKDLLATGCEDKQIRIFYTATNSEKPLKIFTGHTGKVFRVQWSPLREGLLCSGSDDGTVRVWNYSSDSCLQTLQGHSAPVRGLLWHWELAHLLVSGSWDASIKIWDIRDGCCVDTVVDHTADVYGLTSHPDRPFLLASSSRDSTVRLWDISRVTFQLELHLLAAGPDLHEVLCQSPSLTIPGPPAAQEKIGGDLAGLVCRLAGPRSTETAKELLTWRRIAGTKSGVGGEERMSIIKFVSLLKASPYTDNALHLIRINQGSEDYSLPDDYRKGIVHSKHLLKYKGAEARDLELCRIGKFGGGILAPSRRDQLDKASRLHLVSGNLHQFCELQSQLGHWEKALAVSPGVSYEYWAKLTKKYVEVLMRLESVSVIEHCLAIGDTSSLVDHLLAQGQCSQAVLAAHAGLALSDSKRDEHVKESNSNNRHGDTENNTHDGFDLLVKTYITLANSYFEHGSPIQSACCYFAVDDIEGGLCRLIRGNELELVAWIGEEMGMMSPAVYTAREWLARRAEKCHQRDIGLSLLNDHPQRDILVAQFCTRFSGNAPEIDALHMKAGIPSLSECQANAYELSQENPPASVTTIVKLYLLSTVPEKGLELGLRTIKSIISQSGWTIPDIWDLVKLMSAVRTSKLIQQSSRDFKANLLLISGYCATLLAIKRGYTSIVSPLFRYCKMLLERDVEFLNLPITASIIDKEFYTWKLHLQKGQTPLPGEYTSLWTSMMHKAGPDPFPIAPGPDVCSGSHLPSHTNVQISHLTGERIEGPIFYLEDETTVISLNEALMWAKLNTFSPLGTGQRINAF